MFDYDRAFSRNIGWVTEAEQQLLKTKRVAIAGMGGVGGAHLLTLTRLGIGAFSLSDFDRFDIENFNRQAGARLSSCDQPKLDTMVAMALDINPELDIRTFPDGVSEGNVEDFLNDVDIYVDGLDFFAVPARITVFTTCERLGIPVTTAAPLGMGASVLNFMPGKMSFEEYFGLEGAVKRVELQSRRGRVFEDDRRPVVALRLVDAAGMHARIERCEDIRARQREHVEPEMDGARLDTLGRE
jgi:molybdopterin/thiamine biosynthesis adenylyltransferase